MVQFRRLRLSGFKSFVDPTEMAIEKGLTGIVGPNGCGKSNLLEALRWVMGENSPKSMRGNGMEDVIFSGTTGRPSRNFADVTLLLDNSDRTASAAVNESDELEVTRRIERDMGSAFRINGRDARMRDVQLLFADVATGAHSPALVSQGKIGAIVTARPQDRRAILEEAAGISGLHGRRKEAEQRLRGAEGNLARIDDAITQLEAQIAALRRQARQAEKYRHLSTNIRTFEGLVLHSRWCETLAAQTRTQAQIASITSALAALDQQAAVISIAQADQTDALPPLRDGEARAAAALQHIAQTRDALDADMLRVEARRAEVVRQASDAARDHARETAQAQDCSDALARLAAEKNTLATRLADSESARTTAQARVAQAEQLASDGERAFDAITQRNADAVARKQALGQQIEATQARHKRLAGDIDQLAAERAQLLRDDANTDLGTAEARTTAAASALEQLHLQIAETERARAAAEAARDAARVQAEVQREAVRTRAEAARDAARAATEADRDAARQACDAAHARARDAVAAAQVPVAALTAEKAALDRLLAPLPDLDGTPVLDQISVDAGYEKALAAALGDDLSAPVGHSEARYWRADLHSASVAPDNVTAPRAGWRRLSDFVRAPAALTRRLAHVWVSNTTLATDAAALPVGHRLVSPGGMLWRWDGFVAHALTNPGASERLANRNRLAGLTAELEAAQRTLADCAEQADAQTSKATAALAQAQQLAIATFDSAAKTAAEAIASAQAEAALAVHAAQDRFAAAQNAERAARDQRQLLEQALDSARTAQAQLRDHVARRANRVQGLADALTRLQDEATARSSELQQAQALVAQLPDLAQLAAEIADLRKIVDRRRADLAAARVELDGLLRQAHQDRARLSAIEAETAAWEMRLSGSAHQTQVLAARIADAQAEGEALALRPAALAAERAALATHLTQAEALRTQAADALVAADTALRELDRQARAAAAQIMDQREARARLQAVDASQTERLGEVCKAIADVFDVAPAALLGSLESPHAAAVTALADIEAQLDQLKAERERLGPVNLRADLELTELDTERQRIAGERDELVEAIAKLRGAIGSLNREGRQRLLAAFDAVNGHFKTLFATLFGGGDAYLTLIDSDDPLEAGLEIMASPPGKKLQSLTLLSGGEQALTATALIFAVFLTNPSPICVLDEVDAPLDDANVERYCNLLDSMTRRTSTRFLIVTHNAVTMSRMDRLYGVTMAERGVSQLVSVDLGRAEQLLAAE